MEVPHSLTVSAPLSSKASTSSDGRLKELERAIAAFSSPPLLHEEATCLRNLASFVAQEPEEPYLSRKLAGVLVLLHVNPKGGLSVTLTTRSLKLRSHPGDTALPGGRYEEADGTVERTALREACEEIGLPLEPSTHLIYLTSLPAFTSRTILIVIPVVYFLATSAPSVLSSLTPNPDEVSSIFHLPLQAFMGLQTPPRTSRNKIPVEIGSEVLSYGFEDFIWLKDQKYRLHCFNHDSIPSPVTGLTADVLILVVLLGYYGLTEQEAENEEGLATKRLGFAKNAEKQMTWKAIVAHARIMNSQQGLSKDQRTSAT